MSYFLVLFLTMDLHSTTVLFLDRKTETLVHSHFRTSRQSYDNDNLLQFTMGTKYNSFFSRSGTGCHCTLYLLLGLLEHLDRVL